MKHQLVVTSDGSHSLYLSELDEHYHSIHGAIQESNHVFIEAGFKKLIKEKRDPINILEVGLGTGLNVLLSFIESNNTTSKINYTAIEAFPLTFDLVEKLNYSELLNSNSYKDDLNKIHLSEWEQNVELSSRFILHKIKNTLQQATLENNYNLIYFDAFGPKVQPEMWTEEIFFKIYKSLIQGGMLVTYCAKGEVKRTLKKVGFTIESLQGPPGKREMIRAIKLN